MKYLSILLLVAGLALPAEAQEKEKDRVRNAGTVMSEILNAPEDIPQELLDKAECVIVLPSVVKFAFVFGGSYGRGVMTCRSGRDFKGAWGAPTMMALEGGSFGLQIGGQATDYRASGDESPRGGFDFVQQSKAGRWVVSGSRAERTGRRRGNRCGTAGRGPRIFEVARIVCRSFFGRFDTASGQRRAMKSLYGRKMSAKGNCAGEVRLPIPAAAQELLAVLNRRSPKNLSS